MKPYDREKYHDNKDSQHHITGHSVKHFKSCKKKAGNTVHIYSYCEQEIVGVLEHAKQNYQLPEL